MQTRSTLALLVALATGCATAAPPAATARVQLPPGMQAAEADCATLRKQPLTLAPDAPLTTVVRADACGAPVVRDPVASRRWYVQRHKEFDEQSTSHLVVAAMVLTCVLDGSCDPDVDLEAFGYMHAYAAELSLPTVQAELRPRVHPAVGDLFMGRLRQAQTTLAERARSLDPRRRAIYVDLPMRIRAERLAHAKVLAAFDQRFAELRQDVDLTLLSVPSRDTVLELLRSVRQLRDEALLHCTAERPLQACMDGPVVRPLTDQLVQLALRAGDAPQAAAEYESLRAGADRSSFAVHLGVELQKAVDDHQAMVSRYEQAQRERKLDDVLMATAFGTPGPQPLPALAWMDAYQAPVYDGQIAKIATIERVRGIVLASRGAGDALEIALDRCIESAQGCRTKWEASVLIALAEARPLKVGEKLEAFVDRDSRRGVVLYAYRTRPTEKVVQVRGTRLGR